MQPQGAVFDLKAPENADLGLEYAANYDYIGILPKTSDYLIVVIRPTTCPEISKYTIRITVRWRIANCGVV